MKFFLEFLEALARLLRGVPEFLQLPVRVVVFDLIRLSRFLELRDLRLEAGHRFLGAVPLQDDSFDPFLDLIDLIVEGDDLLLDSEDLRVALRG